MQGSQITRHDPIKHDTEGGGGIGAGQTGDRHASFIRAHLVLAWSAIRRQQVQKGEKEENTFIHVSSHFCGNEECPKNLTRPSVSELPYFHDNFQ